MNSHFNPSSELALAVDIGGTKMRAGIVNAAGNLVRRESILTQPRNGIEGATQRLIEAMHKVIGDDSVAGVGLASAGPMFPHNGVYEHPPSLHTWHGKSMKPALEKAMDMPILFGHDATLAAFAEYNFGVHKNADPILYFTISTGVGGGLVSRGRMVTGHNGLAGEFGHIIVDPHSTNTCGGNCQGCLESISSGTSIANSARNRYRDHPQSEMVISVNGNLDDITTSMVFKHAEQGDPVAQRIVDEALDAMAIAFTSVLNSLDPQAIVIGGGVSNHLADIWDDFQGRVAKRALPRFRSGVPVHITTLGDEISMLGAAAMVFANARGEHPAGGA